jgi:hypothetical protein
MKSFMDIDYHPGSPNLLKLTKRLEAEPRSAERTEAKT